MAHDVLNDVGFVDKGDDAPLVLAARSKDRVSFPDFLDEPAPLL